MEQEKAVIEKIRKLLALSESPNENEAAIAASKAAELLSKHNLEIADIGEPIEIVGQIVLEDYATASWKELLLAGVCQLNGLKGFNSKVKHSRRSNAVLIGRPLSILVSKQTFLYLMDVVERLACQHKGKGRAYLNSFRLGVANRLRQRLIAKREQINATGVDGALVAKTQYEKDMEVIAEYVRDLNINKRKQPRAIHREAYEQGKSAAELVNLDEQIREGNAVLGLPSR